MGMDLYVLRLQRPLTPEQAENCPDTRTLFLTPAQAQVLQKAFPDVPMNLRAYEYVNIDRIAELAGLEPSWTLSEWSFSQPAGWAVFTHSEEGDKRVSIESSKVLLRNEDCLTCQFEAAEVAYMRKPFRHYSTPTVVRDGTLMLTTDNFAGTDPHALGMLMGPFAQEFSVTTRLYHETAQLEALGKHCYSAELWAEKVLANMQGPQYATVMDW